MINLGYNLGYYCISFLPPQEKGISGSTDLDPTVADLPSPPAPSLSYLCSDVLLSLTIDGWVSYHSQHSRGIGFLPIRSWTTSTGVAEAGVTFLERWMVMICTQSTLTLDVQTAPSASLVPLILI